MCGKLFVIFWLLFGKSALTASFKDLSMEDRFQTALDKQTFQSILSSIAERLKNLDNIYSIQLSQTLESKLESYDRKIDSLDAKLVRLESLTMMNLDKISENINNKNYKDDVVRTNTYRRLDFFYEGINHRLNYVDKKTDGAHGTIQEKLDLLMIKLEKMEENMAQRSLDVEVELSEALQFTEDLQTTAINVENLINMTNKMLNQTSNNILTNSYKSDALPGNKNNHDVEKTLNKLEKQNEVILNATLLTGNILNEMKTRLADDFNSYANKVADMNTYFWKNSELTHQDIQSMESIINQTRVDLKNGIRALMIQVGKKHERDSAVTDESIDSLKRDLEEVMSSQKLFLDSCYKVQSDESQIESEISETLEKLIDLFQDKMKSAMKDIKNLDKTIKSHDQRITRTIHQANSNIINLYDKTVRGDEKLEKDVAEVQTNLKIILDAIQKLLSFAGDDEAVRKETIGQISSVINEFNLRSYSWTTKEQIQENYEQIKDELTNEINRITVLLNKYIPVIDQLTKNISGKVETLGVNVSSSQSFVNNSLQIQHDTKFEKLQIPTSTFNVENKTEIVINCTQKYNDLDPTQRCQNISGNNKNISEDILMESSTIQTSTSKLKNCTQQYSDLFEDLIDIPGDLCIPAGTANKDNANKNEAIVESATPPVTLPTKVKDSSGSKKNCTQGYANFIDIRSELCTETDITNDGISTIENQVIVESTTQPITLPTTSKDSSVSKKNCTREYSDLIDIRGDLCIETDTTSNDTIENQLAVESTTEMFTQPIKSVVASGIKRNCTQQYSNLIDIRGDLCIETDITSEKSLTQVNIENELPTTLPTKNKEPGSIIRKCPQDYSDLINVRGDLCNESDTTKSTTTQETSTVSISPLITKTLVTEPKTPLVNDEIKQAVLDIFGPQPKDGSQYSGNNDNSITEDDMESKFSTILTEQQQNTITTKNTMFNIDLRNNPETINNL